MTDTVLPLPVGQSRRQRFAADLNRAPLFVHPSAIDALLGPLPTTLEREQAAKVGGYKVVSGVGVLPVFGFLMKRGSGWGDEWDAEIGIRSLERLQATFRAALDDSSVHTLLFQFDSRGGAVPGLFDFADEIFAARGRKAMVSIADEWMASGAYLLAAATDHVLMTRTALAGSIGAVTMRLDATGWDAQQGLKYAVIASGARKADGNPHVALSDAEERDIRADIDALGRQFETAVATYRGLDAGAVRRLEAAVFRGADAIDASIADSATAIGLTPSDGEDAAHLTTTFDRTLTQLVATGGGRGRSFTMSTPTQTSTDQAAAAAAAAATGAAAGPTGAQVIDLSAVRETAEREMADRARSIALACQEAKLPELAAPFIADRLTLEQVKARLGAAGEVVALCRIAGVDQAEAVTMVAAGRSVEQVKAALYDRRLAAQQADGTGTFSHLSPETGMPGVKTGAQHPLVSMCHELAARDRAALTGEAGR